MTFDTMPKLARKPNNPAAQGFDKRNPHAVEPSNSMATKNPAIADGLPIPWACIVAG